MRRGENRSRYYQAEIFRYALSESGFDNSCGFTANAVVKQLVNGEI